MLNRQKLIYYKRTLRGGYADQNNTPVLLDRDGSVQTIWRYVLLQALIDANGDGKSQVCRKRRSNAVKWLIASNQDFQFVCKMAGVVPEFLQTITAELSHYPRQYSGWL